MKGGQIRSGREIKRGVKKVVRGTERGGKN